MEKAAPSITRLKSLPPVPNVCNQTLREVLRTPDFSVAHVVMDKDSTSLPHRHERLVEIYYITEGTGVLYSGPRAFEVSSGSYLVIPPNTPHMLQNSTVSELSHLVISSPPFEPGDVVVLGPEDYKKPIPEALLRRHEKFVARDGAVVSGLLSTDEQGLAKLSLASGELTTGRTAVLHVHRILEEAYYVISGSGKISLGAADHDIGSDTMIYIPRGTPHALSNPSTTEGLKILCISAPPYRDSDFIVLWRNQPPKFQQGHSPS